MNKALIAERFSKAIGTYAQKADIQQQIAEKMTCLLQQHLPATPFNKVVEFGCGTGNYSRLLYHTLQPKQFFLNDLCNGMQACCHDLLDQGAIPAPVSPNTRKARRGKLCTSIFHRP